MKIQDLLRKDVMILDLKATSKEAAIDEMIQALLNTELSQTLILLNKVS